MTHTKEELDAQIDELTKKIIEKGKTLVAPDEFPTYSARLFTGPITMEEIQEARESLSDIAAYLCASSQKRPVPAGIVTRLNKIEDLLEKVERRYRV